MTVSASASAGNAIIPVQWRSMSSWATSCWEGRARGGNHINPAEERENVTFSKKILRKSFTAQFLHLPVHLCTAEVWYLVKVGPGCDENKETIVFKLKVKLNSCCLLQWQDQSFFLCIRDTSFLLFYWVHWVWQYFLKIIFRPPI